MAQRMSHVALTVPRSRLEGGEREVLVAVYAAVFGWEENPSLAIPGERLLLRAPTDAQYLTIRAADSPMSGDGKEHLGIAVDSEDELHAIHARASAQQAHHPDLELEAPRTLYGGALVTFRVRFRLPLSIEVQYVRPAGAA
jgi:hypothetical protein